MADAPHMTQAQVDQLVAAMQSLSDIILAMFPHDPVVDVMVGSLRGVEGGMLAYLKRRFHLEPSAPGVRPPVA